MPHVVPERKYAPVQEVHCPAPGPTQDWHPTAHGSQVWLVELGYMPPGHAVTQLLLSRKCSTEETNPHEVHVVADEHSRHGVAQGVHVPAASSKYPGMQRQVAGPGPDSSRSEVVTQPVQSPLAGPEQVQHEGAHWRHVSACWYVPMGHAVTHVPPGARYHPVAHEVHVVAEVQVVHETAHGSHRRVSVSGYVVVGQVETQVLPNRR